MTMKYHYHFLLLCLRFHQYLNSNQLVLNHYYLNSQSHLNYGKKYGMESCLIKENGLHPNTINRSHITYEMIKNIYEPLGFSHFKIEGRTWDKLSLCLTYCNYMIKPEFHNTVISLLMQDK